jgi:peptide/nickel transport system ATP-binding protein
VIRPSVSSSTRSTNSEATVCVSVLSGDWTAADRLLDESFAQRSVCAREEPAYEVDPEHGSGTHFAACHLHRE